MPTTFKDNKGNSYTLSLTLSKARKVREKLDIDVTNPQELPELLYSLASRLAYAWYLVEDQAKELGIDIDAFETNLQGPGIASGCGDALLAELENFTDLYGQKGIAVSIANVRKVLATQEAKMNDPETIRMIEETVTNMLNGQASG